MLAAACVIWLGWATPNLGPLVYGYPSAALYEDQLLVARVGQLYRGTHEPAQPRVRPPLRYYNWKHAETTWQAKLDIRDDRLLLSHAGDLHRIYPIEDLHLLERSEFADKLCRLRGYNGQTDFISSFECSEIDNLLFPPYRADQDVPIPARNPNRPFDDHPRKKYVRTARYDIQIAGEKTVRLFHAHKDTLFVSVEFDYLSYWYTNDVHDVRLKRTKPPDRELRTGKLPADFTERFAAYTADEHDYLVTDSGKVYIVVPKGRDGLEVIAMWNDPKRKIVGVVQDPANDSVCGWGSITTGAAPERFCVNFRPVMEAMEYKRTVPLWGDRSDAYLESYECARAFRKAAAKK